MEIDDKVSDDRHVETGKIESALPGNGGAPDLAGLVERTEAGPLSVCFSAMSYDAHDDTLAETRHNLRQVAKDRLPTYMRSGKYIPVSVIKRTVSGKADKAGLFEWPCLRCNPATRNESEPA